MDNLPENEKTKEAFKVLERYCQKRYEKAQSFLLGANSENFLGLNSVKSLLTPITTSRFSFQPELKRQQSVLSESPNDPFISDGLPDDGKGEDQECLIERESTRSYLWRLTKFLYDRGLKHVLIIFIVIAYTFLGAFVFYYLEAEHDDYLQGVLKNKIDRSQKIASSAISSLFVHENCIIGNKSIGRRLKISESCNQRVNEILQELTTFVQINADVNPKEQWAWDYWNSVFFALSISTTIGYGNLACKTVKGRIATIFYGLIGIPLMLILLNSIGHVMFTSVDSVWKQIKKMLKRKTRRVRKHIMAGIKSNGNFITTNGIESDQQQMRQNTDATIIEEISEEVDGDLFQTFPIHLAIIIVFLYLIFCSVIICFWESWDYFTAFYFFFISVTTIGFGDEMPEHPRYSICFFIFFIVGLSLVSMLITIFQQRVENQYMQALQLIDEQQQLVVQDALSNSLPQITVGTPDQRLSPDEIDPVLKASSRWRHPSALGINEDVMANYSQNRMNSVSETLSPAEYYASPILSALIKRRHGSQRNLMRSLSKSVTTTANVSLDIETPQSPVKQHSIDFLDTNTASSNNTKRIRPKHLWKEDHGSFKTSVNSLHVPLSIIVESKNDESTPPLAEQDPDSDDDRKLT